jgi:hypothetical protein
MQVDYRCELQFALVGGDLGQIPNPRHVRRLPRAEVAAQQVKSGALRADLSGLVVPCRRRLRRATKPCSRISAATVLGDTCQPISRKSAVIRGEP